MRDVGRKAFVVIHLLEAICQVPRDGLALVQRYRLLLRRSGPDTRPIVELRDGFTASDDGRDAQIMEDLGRGWHHDVMAAGHRVAATDRLGALCSVGGDIAELRIVFCITENAVSSWIRTGRQSRTVHLRGTDINRVMPAKEN